MGKDMDIDATIGNDVTMKGGALAGLGRIDQYELLRELGGGGFGCVFLAKDTVAGIEVAVKGLPPEVKHNKEELENIRENFALVSRLHHPNIAAALVLHPAKEVSYANRDVMEKLRVFEGDTLMVMEYAPGSTLSSWRKQFPGKRVPAEIAIDIVRQVASALDYAHERKIVHRDIKPANVMIEQVGAGKYDVRVLDFGLAAEIRSSMGRVSREIRDMSGTRPYMAPEQWGGEKQGPATDQYALAVMFCELVSGEVPYQSAFESGDSVVMMANVIHQPIKLPEAVPDDFRKTLARALAKKPEKRFPSCMDFVDALGGRRFPWMPVVLTVLAVVICAVVGWCWYAWTKDEGLRMKNEALAAERARQADELQRKAEATRIAAEKAAVERKRVADEEAAEESRLAKIAERKAKDEEEKARKAKEEAERREAEKTRKSEEDAAAVVKREMMRREAEAAKLAEEQRRKTDELRKAADARKAEELKKAAAASTAAAKADMERQRQMARLRERGSEFVPNPPAVAAGTERSVALPNGGRMDFVWCPPGRFLMGSPETEDKRNVDEKPHLVTLTKGFWIGKTEVTRAQWKSVMGDAGFVFSSLWGGDGEFPIDTVSWRQCKEFCDKAGNGFRLPTEAEWEYACRAGTATPFDFGVSLNGSKANCSGGAEPYGILVSGPNSFGSKRVASYQRNPWGIYDMHGNLFEWCADYYAEYPDGDTTDPKGPERGDVRVVRGGCWNYAPKMCRSAFRSRKDPVSADTHTGFRVCCDRLP